MSEATDWYVNVPALEVVQPFGVFYMAKLRADTLLEITFADPLRITEEPTDEFYPLVGAQRKEKQERLHEIANFIETAEAAFPNSIILGANYNKDGKLVEDEKFRWRVESTNGDACLQLIIPTREKLASIIDGQHRLSGFRYVSGDRREMELLCAIYLDIPQTYQAFIFATINFNQKRVDRSLAYQLFGIGLDEEPPDTWNPEKTAVYISRKLNTDPDSPFYRRIIIAAQNEAILFRSRPEEVDWMVSTATVVDGLLRLFSSKPKDDKDRMHQKSIEQGRSRSMLNDDPTPLRKLYLTTNDLAIYTIVKNFFTAVNNKLWSKATERSAIKKTVGIQALFDVLALLMRDLRNRQNENVDVSVEFFSRYLDKSTGVDFSEDFFEASGRGRTRLKNTMALTMGLISEDYLERATPQDYPEYRRLIGRL